MVRIVVDSIKELSERECMALGHMFMHLAGHSLHAALEEEVGRTPMRPIGFFDAGLKETLAKATEGETVEDWATRTNAGKQCVEGNRCEDAPESYTIPSPPGYVKPAVDIVPKAPGWNSQSDVQITSQQDVTVFEDELVPRAAFDNAIQLRDASGIKWDERIHAKNKSQTASGLWKLGRHLSPDFIKQVQAELSQERAACLTPAPSALVPPPPAPIAPVAAVHAPRPPALPVSPPLPSQSLVPPPPPASDPFNDLLNKVTEGTKAGLWTSPAVMQAIKSVKDANGNPICMHMGAVATRPDLIPAISAELDRIAAHG